VGDNEPDILIPQEDRFNFVDDVSWDDFWDIISRSKEWAQWLEYRLSPRQFEQTDITRRQEQLISFLSRTFPPQRSVIWGGGSDMFKHKVKGFISTLITKVGRIFSQIEFSVSVSANEQLNPTITLGAKVDHG